MQDNNFRKTVVLLSDYSVEFGGVGFVLNRPTNLNINELIGSFPDFESKVYYGGPVGNDTIHYIHSKGDLIEDSREISDGLYWGGNFETIKFLAKTEVLKPSDIRFFIGYSGWSPGQLEDEIKEKSWITGELDFNYIFSSRIKDMWHHILNVKGSHFRVIADIGDTFSQN